MTKFSPITKIINGRVLKDRKIVQDDYVWLRDGKIMDPAVLFWEDRVTPDIVIDAKGLLVVPGFIELQLNGGFGVDFTSGCDDIENALNVVSMNLPRYGVTAFCPTVISSLPEVYHKVLPYTVARPGSVIAGTEILGAHLEGPFISDQKYGAHEVSTLTCPSTRGMKAFNEVYGLADAPKDSIAIVTVAPDIDGMMATLPELAKAVPLVSLGHSPATTKVAEMGIQSGARMVTHMFNAMQQFHHRDPGMIGLLGSSSVRPFYGLICDGVHVHPNSIKIAYDAHPDGVCLVTDSMAAMGLPDGKYALGRLAADVTDGKVYLEGTDIIAGSTATMDECVRNFQKYTNCTLVQAIEAATLHPAQAMKIDHKKGSLNFGCDADILFLDDDLKVTRVFLNGEEFPL